MITPEPEIRMYNYDPNVDEFIVLASDGLYDAMSS
jgi:serine/threonine protein phosphatase PrpC